MKKILVVEDSPLVTKIIRHVINQEVDVDAIYVASLAAAKAVVEQQREELFAALVDLNLPDAPDGEVVDIMLANRIPTIVQTASFDAERRDKLFGKGVVDYVTKEGRYSYQYAVNLIKRLHKNQSIKVLVVDDSSTSRLLIKDLLARQLFQVFEAADGVEAIKVLLDNPDIKLLITDYNMPRMDGFELIRNLRFKYEKSDLVIIGLSGEGEHALSARFIKNGANDFLHKPFCQEEFNCRVMHNVESLELLNRLSDAANRDPLTGAYNRRYFFDQGEALYAQAKENHSPLAAAVLDIDHFKRVNDNYGHDAGDAVLQLISDTLSENLGRFLVARAGGEEFFVLMPGLDNDKAVSLMGRLCSVIENQSVRVGDKDIFVTFSVGVCSQLCSTLDEQLRLADEYLYQAKESGRNLVIGDADAD